MLSERKPPATENTGRIGTTIHGIQLERVLRYTYEYMHENGVQRFGMETVLRLRALADYLRSGYRQARAPCHCITDTSTSLCQIEGLAPEHMHALVPDFRVLPLNSRLNGATRTVHAIVRPSFRCFRRA